LRNNFILKLFVDATTFKPASAAITKVPEGTRPRRHRRETAEVTSRRSFVPREAALASALLTATLLTATLFFTLAPLTFALLSVAILLLSGLLSGTGRLARFVWILLCVYDAFIYD
jgi:hypothetical protein